MLLTVATLIVKVNFRVKTTRGEEGHFIVTEGSGHQEGTTLQNGYVPNSISQPGWSVLYGSMRGKCPG